MERKKATDKTDEEFNLMTENYFLILKKDDDVRLKTDKKEIKKIDSIYTTGIQTEVMSADGINITIDGINYSASTINDIRITKEIIDRCERKQPNKEDKIEAYKIENNQYAIHYKLKKGVFEEIKSNFDFTAGINKQVFFNEKEMEIIIKLE
jgi:hypothetical protein